MRPTLDSSLLTLSRGISKGVPGRDSNPGLSKPTLYCLSCAAPCSENKTCLIDQLTVHDHGSEEGEESLGVENTIWAGAVVASGTATGISNKPGNRLNL